jgi:hypothetical protein
MRHFNRFSSLTLICFACVLSAGCIIPVPTTKGIKSVDGVRMPKHLGIRSFRPGSTRRDEVLQKIGWADAGLQCKGLFLARWKVSQMAVCVGVAAPGTYGGAADCGRVWQGRNLIIQFEGNGVVQKVQRVPDHDIGKVLAAWLATDPELPLDLSRPIQIPVERGHNSAELTLARAYIVYHDKAKNLRIPRQQVLGASTLGWRASSSSIRIEIQYQEVRKAAKKLRFRMPPSNLLTLIEYLEQARAQGPPMPGILETHQR